ncbi:MAG: arsenate reductase ArsC [Pseudomonadota bacterium]
MADPLHVLILCTGNSARSILGEAILDHLGGDRFVSHSAGSHPKEMPHPEALNRLAIEGLRSTGWRSKSWDEFEGETAPALDIVITVCDSAAGETCPYWPGAPATVHWGLPDPANASVETQPAAFKAAFDALQARMAALVALPVENLTPAERKARLADIHAAHPS